MWKNYFNPRTREGCDLYGHSETLHRKNFNPRTREGCDQRKKRVFGPNQHFNPRTREGCDGWRAWKRSRRIGFQSTHPRGVRRIVNTKFINE